MTDAYTFFADQFHVCTFPLYNNFLTIFPNI